MNNLYQGEAWLGEAPEISEREICEEISAELIVVGGGLAGVAACRRATELGARTVLFEKCQTPQARSGDFSVMDSRLAEKWGRRGVDKVQIVADLMKDMCYMVDQRILKTWAERAGTALDWYLQGAPDCAVLADTFETPPDGCKLWIQPRRLPQPDSFDNAAERYKCYQTTAWIRPNHLPVFQANYRMAEATGLLRGFFSTPAVKLLRGEDGRVCGVIARSPQGGYIRAAAARGVILATGDYMSDAAMLMRFCPRMVDTPKLWTSFDRDKRASNTGDGHRMGLWVGARLQDAPHAPLNHHMGSVFGASGFLLLDGQGRRFVNEDVPGQQIGDQIENLPGREAWQFVDGDWAAQVPHVHPNHGSVCYALSGEDVAQGRAYRALGTIDNCVTEGLVEKAVRAGKLLSRDSLPALVQATGLPETALQSIARYNALCARGEDADFGKRALRLFPVLKPPFYAARFTTATMIAVMGGLQSDEAARCYDVAGHVIAGLFVAGNVQGNRFAVAYPLTVPGISHSMALTYGMIAAESALA
ncbi:MAG: FAD-binding protein [Oscillospiraceae bacterium]|jgi:succinate dehydrogenase/fumarate reductase flavoprotein subunit|nr:FAD-binding protein [Oscillospiraceae bacterium]